MKKLDCSRRWLLSTRHPGLHRQKPNASSEKVSIGQRVHFNAVQLIVDASDCFISLAFDRLRARPLLPFGYQYTWRLR